MSSVVMALDSGTTSIRAILFDHDGEVVAAASRSSRRSTRSRAGSSTTRCEIWSTQVDVAE